VLEAVTVIRKVKIYNPQI